MDHLTHARCVINLEIEAIKSMADRLGPSFTDSIDLLRETLEAHRKIIVIGIGKSGNIGHKIAATLNSTGATAVVLNSQNALHGDLGLVSDGDAVLALSQSGETPELLNLLPFLKRNRIHLIALTGKLHSTLAKHADQVLDTSVDREACPLNLAPTSSSTAMLVLGDALAMVLLQARGFKKEDFARYHPGGSLGRALLTKVSDIMRSGEALATVQNGATIREALLAMSRKRTGACLILEKNGTLAGIFTHGDFARAYQADPDLGQRPIADHMTRNPISVSPDSLAAEAVNIVRERRIDDIVVLSPSGHPLGLIDSQDFAPHQLV